MNTTRTYSTNNRQTFAVQTPGRQNAQSNYERSLSLARNEATAGNRVDAEYWYQHAEHYFRTMQRHQN
ncbi:DUF4167 domain-containing protein (plasmid) [Phyllobacterium sp. A18/5-2]|uniref:DUF4167 domain-containing protein n=1 Tax=Phyllobacterium sp. A18/5-2 TaxID=2978392 RepID=UPI0021C800D9|nr:DUF4167 domain-containing protein [Phyllobacterium sp. A18/5-2]UXN67288.1 DUF4167 domain-containing protein [Phyllobacterium sp. A18/5-2]